MRPEWKPEYDRLTVRYDGFATPQEIEVIYNIILAICIGKLLSFEKGRDSAVGQARKSLNYSKIV